MKDQNYLKSYNTILLVEDDQNDVLLVKRAFKKANNVNNIQVVNDGEAAIAYLDGDGEYQDRNKYPLPIMILLDLKLPKKSGHEVLAWRQGKPVVRRIPVVVLSSSNRSEDVNRAYDLGANSYLNKPMSFDDLVTMVKELNMYWQILNLPPHLEIQNK